MTDVNDKELNKKCPKQLALTNKDTKWIKHSVSSSDMVFDIFAHLRFLNFENKTKTKPDQTTPNKKPHFFSTSSFGFKN